MRIKGPEALLWRLSRYESVGRAVAKERERRARKILGSILMADGSCSGLCRMYGIKDVGGWVDVGLIVEGYSCWFILWRLGSSAVLPAKYESASSHDRAQ